MQITFKEFLQQKMTHWDFEHLPDLLEESPHRVTKIINDPTTGTLTQLLKILELTSKVSSLPFVSADTLITLYRFGEQCITEAEKDLLFAKSSAR